MLSRRELFRLAGATLALAACGDNLHPGDGVFTAAQRTLLEKFADVIIPPDDTPGGKDLGAVAYIEKLLTAFDMIAATPAIYANGPFSDRDGGTENDFAQFVELDRVNDAAWRGIVMTTKQQLLDGLDAAATSSADPQTLFDAQTDDFKTLLIDLVFEAAWAAPEYGGNPELAGWDLIHFEGDVLPNGYTAAQVGQMDPGPDPDPIGSDVDQLLQTVVAVLGGRSA